jgi:hypothetical protein
MHTAEQTTTDPTMMIRSAAPACAALLIDWICRLRGY